MPVVVTTEGAIMSVWVTDTDPGPFGLWLPDGYSTRASFVRAVKLEHLKFCGSKVLFGRAPAPAPARALPNGVFGAAPDQEPALEPLAASTAEEKTGKGGSTRLHYLVIHICP